MPGIDIAYFLRNTGEWLRGDGPASEIVISTRVRLARNLARHRFPLRLDDEEKAVVTDKIREALADCPSGKDLSYFDLAAMDAIERHLLVERHLISREQEEAEGARGAAIDPTETISVMVNEEDHIRLQALRSGLQISAAFATADRLDDELAERLEYAFHEEWGYLTACPTNLGTGMRVSVMVHLPALVMSRHAEKAFRAVHDLRMNIRGLYGEGTEAHGEFYQISNQITIGRAEQEIIDDMQSAIEALIRYETAARQKIWETEPAVVEDRVWRAYATLRHARLITSEEAMKHLSAIRLGAHLGILRSVETQRINTIFVFSQPAHLQRMEGQELPPRERDMARARYLRRQMAAADAAPEN